MDATENVRRALVGEINSQVVSNSKDEERARLEQQYGKVWDTQELSADFDVQGFMAPFIAVKRKSDGKAGTMLFQHMPRFYFSFS